MSKARVEPSLPMTGSICTTVGFYRIYKGQQDGTGCRTNCCHTDRHSRDGGSQAGGFRSSAGNARPVSRVGQHGNKICVDERQPVVGDEILMKCRFPGAIWPGKHDQNGTLTALFNRRYGPFDFQSGRLPPPGFRRDEGSILDVSRNTIAIRVDLDYPPRVRRIRLIHGDTGCHDAGFNRRPIRR